MGGGWDSLEHYLLRHASQMMEARRKTSDTSFNTPSATTPMQKFAKISVTPSGRSTPSFLRPPSAASVGYGTCGKIVEEETFNLRPGWTKDALLSARAGKWKTGGSMMNLPGSLRKWSNGSGEIKDKDFAAVRLKFEEADDTF